MSRRVKRSCRTCGWSGTYTSIGRADYAKRIHSCEKWSAKLAGQRRRAERLATVDRTPQPCLHKRANHKHGTRAAYVLDQCRCLPCSKANAAAELHRERQKAYGRYDRYVDAEPVRQHLTALRQYGIGLKAIGKLAGVSSGSLTKIYYGTYASIEGPNQGRYGAGDLVRGPAKRVLRTTAERLQSVQAVPANLPATRPDPHRTPQARAYLRALVALGWSQAKLARRLGMQASNFARVVTSADAMKRQTVDAVLALYAELSMTPPPESNQRERIAASRARRRAKELGWLPPLDLEAEGWTDTGEPYLDESAIQRRLDGDTSVHLTRAERRELTARMHRWRMSTRSMSNRTGYSVEAHGHDLRQLGLAPHPLETRHPIPAPGGQGKRTPLAS